MRKVKIQIKDKEYTLEMNRASIKWLEMNGFVISDFEKKPVTYYDLLWHSLFLKNHPSVSENLAIKLMDEYIEEGNSASAILNFAIEEYSNFINALADTNSKKKTKLEIITE